jgi:hypothetical protein
MLPAFPTAGLPFEPLMRIELTTSSLPRKCSTTELQRLFESLKSVSHLSHQKLAIPLTYLTYLTQLKSGRRGSNPRPTAWKAVALPTELLPRNNWKEFIWEILKLRMQAQFPNPLSRILKFKELWARMDSNHRTRKRADLQSAAVGHLATCPS